MKKILYKIIACLLIPSFVFAQPYPYQSNEKSIRQTDLSKLLKALETDVGKEIITYVETTVGNINLEQAKSFTIAKEEIAFVPIKSFSKMLAALCYRQLEDGAEYLFLITFTATEKAVTFTFPSGQMYVIKSSGVTESANPDFQFQEYNDLSNHVGITATAFIDSLCSPVISIVGSGCWSGYPWAGMHFNPICYLFVAPFLFIYAAYSYPVLNLEVISIIFAVYIYGCVLNFFAELYLPLLDLPRL
jgi:hypothetical protein